MSLSNNFPTIRPAILLDFANVGRLDPRVTFTRASTATYFDQLGVLQSAANDTPRFDYNPSTLQPRGLLIEEQRTNSIRNNTMQGAVAGTPGTVPTNWTAPPAVSGLTYEIVGTGTDSGITYIDVKISGTSGATGDAFIAAPETTTGVAALNGQTWTQSMYVKIQGGSLSGVDAVQFRLSERDSGGGNLTDGRVNIVPTTAALNTQRYTQTRTNNNASTAFLFPSLLLNVTTGSVIDITLRIGLPQLELGAFATSVIPTTTTALTRNADVASMTGTNFSSWFNAAEGSLFCRFNVNGVGSASYPAAACFDDGSSLNAIELSMWDAVSDSLRWVGYVSNVAQWSISPLNYTSPNFVNGIGTYKQNSFNAAFNGTLGTEDTSGNVPTVNRLLIGQNRGGGANFLNGHIQRIAYYPTRLTNAQLQALTG